MKIEEIQAIIARYENLKEFFEKKILDLIEKRLVTPSPFYQGRWYFKYVDGDIAVFEDDDFYHGYDLHDRVQVYVKLSLFTE